MMYDLLDAQRQYRTYLENLRLLHVPVAGESGPPIGQHPTLHPADTPSIVPAGNSECPGLAKCALRSSKE